jgi:phage-related protein
MKQFGISSKEAYTLMAQGAQQGADKNGDLLDTLNEYSPQFKALGFNAEQFTDVLIQGAENGAWSIDKVGDAVKEFTIRTKDGSKSTNEAFQSLGLDADKMGAAFAAGGAGAQQAFQAVLDSLGSLEDPMQRNQVGVALFGTQFEDLEADAILALGNIQSRTDQTADTLQRINDIKYNSFGDALQGIGRQLETGIMIPLGEAVLPLLNQFANWLAEKLPVILEWFRETFGGAGDQLSAFGEMWNWLYNEIIKPILDALVPYIQEQLAKIREFWDENGAEIMKLVETAFKRIIDTIKVAMATAGDVLRIAWEVISGVFNGALTTLMGLWQVFSGLLAGDWAKVWEGLGNVVSGVWGAITATIKGAINLIITAINTFIRSMNKIKFDVPDWVPGFGGKEWGINFPLIPMLAKGTDYFQGGMALVGEEGPELVNLPRGSQVIPNDRTNSMLNAQPEYVVVKIDLDGRSFAEVLARPLNDLIQQSGRGAGYAR